MTSPVYTCEVAFTNTNPLVDPGSWTDITALFRGIDSARGRQHELSRTQAGTADIRLRNIDRRFDPAFAFGAPYTGNVLPMRQIRVRATFAATTYDVFRGFVEDWGQSWGGRPLNASGEAECQVHAVDAFKVLSVAKLRSYSAEVLADSPVFYVPLTDPVGTSSVENLGSAGGVADLSSAQQNSIGVAFGRADSPFLATTGQSCLDAFDALFVDGLLTPNAFTVADPITLEVWIKPDAFGGAPLEIASLPNQAFLWGEIFVDASGHVTYAYRNSDGVSSTSVARSAVDLAIGTWTHVAVVRQGSSVIFYANGIPMETRAGLGASLQGTAFTPGAIGMGNFNGAIAHAAVYDQALPASRIAAHAAANMDTLTAVPSGTAISRILTAVGWPAGLQTLDAGVSTVIVTPNGFALDVLQQIAEDTEHGLFYVSGAGKITFVDRATLQTKAKVAAAAVFGDSGTDVPYEDLNLTYDDHDLWTEVLSTGADGSEIAADDATAQAAYGVRTLPEQSLAALPNEVYDHAVGLLGLYKAPALRPSSMSLGGTSSAQGSTSSLKEQLARGIGDLVTVKRLPPGGGSALNVPALVEGVKQSTSGKNAGRLETEFSLVPAFPVPWILGDAVYSVLGSTTIPGW